MLYLGQVLIAIDNLKDNQAMLYICKKPEKIMSNSNNDVLSEKIRVAIEQSKMEKKEIADAIGVSKQSITGWEKTGRISKSSLSRLAILLKIDVGWFLSSEAIVNSVENYGKLILVSNGKQAFDQNVWPANIGKRPIPVISAVQAGALTEMTDPYLPGGGFAVEYVDDDFSRWAFALVIEGDSMLPDFRPGDRVLFEPELAPNPGDYVIAKNGNNEATFKKYRPRGIDDQGNVIFELTPLNDDYPSVRSDQVPLQVIAVMVEQRKKFRRK